MSAAKNEVGAQSINKRDKKRNSRTILKTKKKKMEGGSFHMHVMAISPGLDNVLLHS